MDMEMNRESEVKVRDVNADKVRRIVDNIAVLEAEAARLERYCAVVEERILVHDTRNMTWAAMGRLLGCHAATANKRVTAARSNQPARRYPR